jgi:hypothetical protein
MAWVNHDDAQWEPHAFYWLMTVIAAFMAIFVVADFFISWAQGARAASENRHNDVGDCAA